MLQSYPIADGLGIRVEVARIDAAIAIAFKDRMKAMTEAGTGRIVIDLGAVTFVDSSGLGAIVGAMKQLPPGRTLELAGLTAAVERVFHLTRMDTVFRIHRDAASAGAATQQV